MIMGMDALQGSVERITFYNAENGYTVLRLHVPGQPELVTLSATSRKFSRANRCG